MSHRLPWLVLSLALASCEDEAAAPAHFRVAVQTDVTGFQGADALVKVTLERDPGFSDDVEVSLAGAGDDLASAGVRFSKSMTEGYVLIGVGLDAAVEKRSLSIIATSGTVVADEPFTLDVREASPFAQQLIEAARAEGTIDDGTALLYRAYAMMGDPSLPEAYRGAGSYEEDNFLVPEINEALPTLSTEMQDALLPFVARPSDPGSYWNAGLSADLTARASDGLPVESCGELTTPGFQWVSRRSASYPVRVWVSCLGQPLYDAQSMELLDATMKVLEQIWQPEGEMMGDPKGNPLLDEGGGDEAIDVYVDRGPGVVREGKTWKTGHLGEAFPTAPLAGQAMSGFIVIPATTYGSPRFHTSIIHELFHVHQFRHNAFIAQGETKHWFYEATATWAAAHFDHQLDLWRPRGAHPASYARFKARFQVEDASLSDPSDLHSRSAYIWPYFMQQNGAGPDVIAKIWKNLAAAGESAEKADNIIDAAYPFDEHFREFALRNINEALEPGDPLPKDKRYINADPEFRDDGVGPVYSHIFEIAEELSSEGFEVSIKPLKARYLKFTVKPNIKQLIVTLPDPVAFPKLDVDVLVKKDGTWESKPRDLTGKETLELCEPVQELRFILSNPQRLPGDFIETALAVTASTTECMATWHGTASHELTDGPGNTLRLDADVTWILDPDQSGPGMEVYYPTGTVTVTQTKVDCTVTWAPTVGQIAQDMMSSLAIYPDGTGGFIGFGSGVTMWDSTRTDVCPLNTPSTVVQEAPIGGSWFQGMTTVSPDGKTMVGSAGITGDKYEWSFTKD